jgi:hypothetical protein
MEPQKPIQYQTGIAPSTEPSVSPTVPVRTSSLAATANQEEESFEPVSRAHKKKLKRSASSLNKFVNPEDWWIVNDELVRIDLDEARQLYLKDKRLYEDGTIEKSKWDKYIIAHLSA